MTALGLVGRLRQFWLYYGVGLINMAFGYGCYSALVALGMNMYLAQLVGQPIAMAFNYVTYSRLVFTGSQPAMPAFIGSYVLNYGLSLAFLFLFSHVISSPYLAGLAALVAVSVLNFFVLKHLVFKPGAS